MALTARDPASYNERTSTAEKIIVAAILLAGVLVRLPGLEESLWFDEIFRTASTFKQPSILSYFLFGDVHPPLDSLILLAWTTLFGDSEVSVRLSSLLFNDSRFRPSGTREFKGLTVYKYEVMEFDNLAVQK